MLPVPTHCPICGEPIVQRRLGGTSRFVTFLCDRGHYLRKERVREARAAGIYIEHMPNCPKHRLPLAYQRASGRPGCFDCLVEECD